MESTRKRILQMIHPSWKVKAEMGTSNWFYGMTDPGGECTENVLLRLVFHDCIPYVDGNDGWACDGCFNWKNMGAYTPRNGSFSCHYSLPRKKSFLLKFLSHQNASKFTIFLL